jgi:hypothetical protein
MCVKNTFGMSVYSKEHTFSVFFLLEWTYKTEYAENVQHLLKACIHPLQCVSSDFAKCFWVSVGYGLFNIVFQFP